MISGQWCQRQGSKHWKILHKITHNSIKTRSSTLIFKQMWKGKKHPHQICNMLCIGFRDNQKGVKQRSFIKKIDADHGIN